MKVIWERESPINLNLNFQTTTKTMLRRKNGTLRPGKLHVYKESEKIIINFPTKDKWREKSRMEYIEDGLDALVY